MDLLRLIQVAPVGQVSLCDVDKQMLAGAAPSLPVSGRKLMTLMVDAKLLRNDLEIDSLLEPAPLQRLPP